MKIVPLKQTDITPSALIIQVADQIVWKQISQRLLRGISGKGN
jgi:hypothetical protein